MSNKVTKDSDAPKKPRNSFLRFSADERPKLKAQGIHNFIEISKALGTAWHEVDQTTKVRYENEYAKDKRNYEKKLNEYKNKKNNDTTESVDQSTSKGKRAMKKIDENVYNSDVNLDEEIKENTIDDYQQRQEVIITIKICTDQMIDLSIEEPKFIQG